MHVQRKQRPATSWRNSPSKSAALSLLERAYISLQHGYEDVRPAIRGEGSARLESDFRKTGVAVVGDEYVRETVVIIVRESAGSSFGLVLVACHSSVFLGAELLRRV